MIIIDKKYPDCTSIDSNEFIKRTVGFNNPENGIELPEEFGNLYWSDETEYIEQFLSDGKTLYKSVHRDSVYNHENCFSDVFVFEVFVPIPYTDANNPFFANWCYSDECYISITMHRGGDVRGNYGATRLYKIDGCIAECGFLDWTIGWDLYDLQNNRIDNTDTDRLSIGYSSYPWGELTNIVPEKTIHWSDKRQAFVGRYNGNTVLIKPYTNIA